MRAWTVRDSLELYNIPNWGRGFFSVNERGRVEVRPRGPESPAIDLLSLVQDLTGRGVRSPMLVRFSDILASRVRGLARRLPELDRASRSTRAASAASTRSR